MKAWLSRFFSKKPKPKLYPAHCIECGAEALSVHPPGTPVIHLDCEIKRINRAKAEAKTEAKRREKIEIIKTAIRELDAEKADERKNNAIL